MKHEGKYETLVDNSGNPAFKHTTQDTQLTTYKVESGGNSATEWTDWLYNAAYEG